MGGFFQSVAAAWLMLDLTGSPVWVSAMAASTTLPLLFLSLPSGALADLANRRNVLLVTQCTMLASVLGMTGFALADVITPPLLLAFGLLLGRGPAFNAPVWMAMVPDLVPREMVPDAVALNSVSFNAARAVGPALGGLIVAAAGPGVAFAVNAATYVGVLAVILSFPAADWAPQEEAPMTRAIVAGVRYARFSPALLWLLGVAAGFALTSASLQVLLPNVTRERPAGRGHHLRPAARGDGGGGAGRAPSPGPGPPAASAGARWRLGIAVFGAAGRGRRPVAPPLADRGADGRRRGGVGVGADHAERHHPDPVALLGARPGPEPVHPGLLRGVAGGVAPGRRGGRRHRAPTGRWWPCAAGPLLLGVAAWRMPIVGIEDVSAPEIPEDYDLTPHGDAEIAGGPGAGAQLLDDRRGPPRRSSWRPWPNCAGCGCAPGPSAGACTATSRTRAA